MATITTPGLGVTQNMRSETAVTLLGLCTLIAYYPAHNISRLYLGNLKKCNDFASGIFFTKSLLKMHKLTPIA